MKKVLLPILIIIVVAGAWWNYSPRSLFSVTGVTLDTTQAINAPMKSPEEIVAADYEKIAKNLSAKNTSKDEWKQINNYSLTPEALVTHTNAKTYFLTAQSNVPDIFSCLKKDFCGMETRGEGDAYFDDQKTPAHILLKRNLLIMKQSLRLDGSLRSEVDWDLMKELATSGSDLLAVEALGIIREFDSESMKTDDLIKVTQDLKGQAKADALVNLSKKTNSTDKILLASEVSDVFASGDADSVISVLEKLRNMSLGANATRTLIHLCRFKVVDDPSNANWLMIKMLANKVNIDFEKMCN
jgi:hypothetical protein